MRTDNQVLLGHNFVIHTFLQYVYNVVWEFALKTTAMLSELSFVVDNQNHFFFLGLN